MTQLPPGNYPSEFEILDYTFAKEPLYSERKYEILLAGDLRRFTETMEYLQKYGDPEEMVSFLSKLFGKIAEIVERQDGSINKFLGDGFLVHYEIKPGKDIYQILHQIVWGIYDVINCDFPQLRASSFLTKIGLSIVISRVPDVIWARIGGPSYWDYSMIGKDVNKLFRALDSAKGNLILISDDLGQFLNNNWVLVEIGKQALDGVLHPIELFSVLRPREPDEKIDKYIYCVPRCPHYHICKVAYDRGIQDKELINCQYCMRSQEDPICWHWGDCNVKDNYGKAKGNHDDFTCCHICNHFKSCFHSYFLGRFKKKMIWCGKPYPN